MKKYACLMLVLALMGCQRTPIGNLGIASAGSGNLLSSNANDNTSQEVALKRQERIDANLEASAEKIKNVFNDTSDPVDLEHLTNRNDVDPALANTREFRDIQRIEEKFDQKARDLIDNTGDLKLTPDSSTSDAVDGRDLDNQNKIDQKLDQDATDFANSDASSDEEPAKVEPSPEPSTNTSASSTDSSEPSTRTPSSPTL